MIIFSYVANAFNKFASLSRMLPEKCSRSRSSTVDAASGTVNNETGKIGYSARNENF